MGFIGKQPSKTAITSSDITDGVVTADKLASNAVTTAKINADAVTDAKIADDVVGSEHLTAGEVDTTALGADAVTAAKIADDAISDEHLDPTAITGQTAETSAADDDLILLSDTSASAALKKMTRSNFLSGVGGNNKPIFYAYQNSTQGSIADVTQTKITFQAELFDADGVYDTSNSKFTAPSAGKYFFHAALNNAYFYSTTGYQLNLHFYKNGSNFSEQGGFDFKSSTDIVYGFGLSKCIVMDLAQDDYIEIYVYGNTYNNGAWSVTGTNSGRTFFTGYKLIE